jgi:hypothetical protein
MSLWSMTREEGQTEAGREQGRRAMWLWSMT